MSVILAIDPGSKACGFVEVRPEGARIRFLRAGEVESSFAAVANLLGDVGMRYPSGPVVVGIERPTGFVHQPFRGPTLLDTAWIAGGVGMGAHARGYRVVELSAKDGRKLVIGKATAGRGAKVGSLDRAVKDALPSFVDGLPKQTNVHVRDSLVIAVATAWILLGQRRAA